MKPKKQNKINMFKNEKEKLFSLKVLKIDKTIGPSSTNTRSINQQAKTTGISIRSVHFSRLILKRNRLSFGNLSNINIFPDYYNQSKLSIAKKLVGITPKLKKILKAKRKKVKPQIEASLAQTKKDMSWFKTSKAKNIFQELLQYRFYKIIQVGECFSIIDEVQNLVLIKAIEKSTRIEYSSELKILEKNAFNLIENTNVNLFWTYLKWLELCKLKEHCLVTNKLEPNNQKNNQILDFLKNLETKQKISLDKNHFFILGNHLIFDNTFNIYQGAYELPMPPARINILPTLQNKNDSGTEFRPGMIHGTLFEHIISTILEYIQKRSLLRSIAANVSLKFRNSFLSKSLEQINFYLSLEIPAPKKVKITTVIKTLEELKALFDFEKNIEYLLKTGRYDEKEILQLISNLNKIQMLLKEIKAAESSVSSLTRTFERIVQKSIKSVGIENVKLENKTRSKKSPEKNRNLETYSAVLAALEEEIKNVERYIALHGSTLEEQTKLLSLKLSGQVFKEKINKVKNFD